MESVLKIIEAFCALAIPIIFYFEWKKSKKSKQKTIEYNRKRAYGLLNVIISATLVGSLALYFWNPSGFPSTMQIVLQVFKIVLFASVVYWFWSFFKNRKQFR